MSNHRRVGANFRIEPVFRVACVSRIALAFWIAAALPALACSDDLVEPGPADPVVPEPTDPSPPDPIVIPPRSASAEAAVLEKSNAFAWNLLPAAMAADPEANVLVSPLSASMALGMALNGARGTTYDQMRATLGFEDAPLDTINLGYHGLMAHLPAADSSVSTQLANSAWYRDGFAVEQSFMEAVRAFFDAEIAGLDFSSAAAADTINQWVSEKTGGRIEEIVESPIDDRTMLFLINAIYFRGPWKYAFDPQRTQDAPFHIADGQSQSMPMMELTAEFPYGEDGNLQVIELPFGEGAFAMTVLVPGAGSSIDAELASMDVRRWQSLLDNLNARRVRVVLPRFRVEYDESLKPVLAGARDDGRLPPQRRRLHRHLRCFSSALHLRSQAEDLRGGGRRRRGRSRHDLGRDRGHEPSPVGGREPTLRLPDPGARVRRNSVRGGAEEAARHGIADGIILENPYLHSGFSRIIPIPAETHAAPNSAFPVAEIGTLVERIGPKGW